MDGREAGAPSGMTPAAAGVGGEAFCALVWRVQQLAPVSKAARDRLLALKGPDRRVARGETLIAQGEAHGRVHLIQSGWCASARLLKDGRRQIHRIAIPGDFIMFDALLRGHSPVEIEALSEMRVAPLDEAGLKEAMATDQRVFLALMAAVVRDESALIERLASLGRRSAEERLAHFLVELQDRLVGLGLTDADDGFDFPVTREQLADAMGLTTIHIYRTLRRLKDKRLCELRDGRVRIFDLAGLSRLALYDPHVVDPPLNAG
ncbi:MAG: Crp/Fnr family transcriptional regulator [Marivibrio sp.]|uniref:Crp/Fnr family transcriptional regulator n=1 Tax=Marivibrio sp. TaxID=2039719 RepID=UPI0032F0625B